MDDDKYLKEMECTEDTRFLEDVIEIDTDGCIGYSKAWCAPINTNGFFDVPLDDPLETREENQYCLSKNLVQENKHIVEICGVQDHKVEESADVYLNNDGVGSLCERICGSNVKK